MAEQQKVEELTSNEALVLDLLRNLGPGERTTVKFIAKYTQIYERTIYEILESLRTKGYPVISSKNKDYLGTFCAKTEAEWNDYIHRREKENVTEKNSIERMKKNVKFKKDATKSVN